MPRSRDGADWRSSGAPEAAVARRRRERPEPAAWDGSGEDSSVEELEEEESAPSFTPASGELFDALWDSGADSSEEPRAWRIAATSSLFRMREVPLRPMEPASDWSSARRMVESEGWALEVSVTSVLTV